MNYFEETVINHTKMYKVKKNILVRSGSNPKTVTLN